MGIACVKQSCLQKVPKGLFFETKIKVKESHIHCHETAHPIILPSPGRDGMDAEGENAAMLYRAPCRYQGWDLGHSLTQKKIKCLQVAVYVPAGVQALTTFSGCLVRTVNCTSRAPQLMSHCSRNLCQNIRTWYQLGCPGFFRTPVRG